MISLTLFVQDGKKGWINQSPRSPSYSHPSSPLCSRGGKKELGSGEVMVGRKEGRKEELEDRDRESGVKERGRRGGSRDRRRAHSSVFERDGGREREKHHRAASLTLFLWHVLLSLSFWKLRVLVTPKRLFHSVHRTPPRSPPSPPTRVSLARPRIVMNVEDRVSAMKD